MDIFPAVDIKDGRCVRLRQGRYDDVTVYGEDPVEAAARWRDLGAKWLHLVDLDGARSGVSSETNLAAVRRIVDEIGLPVQLGGGVRSLETARMLIDAGVTRVIVGTTAATDADLTQALIDQLGDRLAIGVDARDGRVAISGWEAESADLATDFVARLSTMGARRFIFTDIRRDGMLEGVNLNALAEIAVTVPDRAVIASGGVAGPADIERLVELRRTRCPNIEGVIIGKALYAGSLKLEDALRIATNDSDGTGYGDSRHT